MTEKDYVWLAGLLREVPHHPNCARWNYMCKFCSCLVGEKLHAVLKFAETLVQK